MKQRTHKQLLTILLESLKKGYNENYHNGGLCGQCDNLYYTSKEITHKENLKLQSFINLNKPTARNKYKDFFNNKNFRPYSAWWWIPMRSDEIGRTKRIEFVKALINNL